jgi:hypothetical protein
MSNEISTEGPPSAFTEEDHLSAMIVERDIEIARLKGVIEHLQGVIGGLHMEAAQRDALTTKPVEGSIDTLEFRNLARAWVRSSLSEETPNRLALIAHITDFFARKAAVGGQDWQPIETAPKDGSRFLAAINGKVGFFQWQDFNDGGKAPVGWRDNFINVYPEGFGPTLWMPVPAIEPSITAQVSGQSGEGA